MVTLYARHYYGRIWYIYDHRYKPKYDPTIEYDFLEGHSLQEIATVVFQSQSGKDYRYLLIARKRLCHCMYTCNGLFSSSNEELVADSFMLIDSYDTVNREVYLFQNEDGKAVDRSIDFRKVYNSKYPNANL